MPLRKNAKSKAKTKRSTYQNNRRKNIIPKSMVSFGTGLPEKVLVKHKYNQISTLVSTSGSTATQHFSANSMFDPDITGIGHQPIYFDEISGIWNRYRVVGSKITVKVTQASSANGPMQIVLYRQDDSTVSSSNVVTQSEYTHSSKVMLPSGGSAMAYLNQTYSMKKVFGPGKDTESLSALSTASPSESYVYTLVARTLDATSGSCVCDVSIEYLAVWTELKDVAGS